MFAEGLSGAVVSGLDKVSYTGMANLLDSQL